MSFGFYFAVYYGSDAVVSPGGYIEGVVSLGISNALQPNGEAVTLNSTAPAGITVSYNPASPVQLTGEKALNVSLTVTASATVAVGNYTVSVKGVSGTNSQSASFMLRVVPYRIVMSQNEFFPGVLNITAGSTILWQNLDGPLGGCAAPGASSGNGQHNVVFTTLPGANSSTINQFQTYSYTFTTPGNYFYYSSIDTDHLMNGTINVEAAGGGGAMTVNMPVFSYFKEGGSPTIAPAAIAATAAAAAKPAGAGSATSLVAVGTHGLADLVFPNAHSSAFSGLGFGAVVSVLLGVAALGAALAMSTSGKRKLTAVGLGIVARLLPSHSSE